MKKAIVQHVAQLANLKLSKEEVSQFQKELAEIIDYVDQLKKVKTQGIEPTSQVTGLENVFRQDIPHPSLSQSEVLANAKKQTKGLIKVKAIFKEIT